MSVVEPPHAGLLSHLRCLVVTLGSDGLVHGVDCPWGAWRVEGIEVGRPLPETLQALIDATPPAECERLYPFVYLDDGHVADVQLGSDGARRQLLLRDVNEVHAAELKYQQKAHEVSLLLEQQERLTRQLERANAAKSRFIASMSHEFRTPITAIMGQAELLFRHDPGSGAAAAIQRASWHLLALVENLLEQARLGEGEVQLHPSSVDLGLLLDDMRELFEGLSQSKGLALAIDPPPRGVRLETDELRLRQVLINLLGNAVRYTPAGSVGLELEEKADGLEFRVRDTGPGIEAKDQRRIFEPFTRLEPGRQTGAGLGLAVSRQLVEAMGGRLELDSVPGRGSTFRFALPGKTDADREAQGLLEARRVLLVDDDPDVLAIHELFLADMGMAVYAATGVNEALALAEREVFDLALVDLHLGEDSGIGILDRLRRRQPACRTVLCTGAGASPGPGSELGTPPDAFLSKPASPDQLREALLRALAAADS